MLARSHLAPFVAAMCGAVWAASPTMAQSALSPTIEDIEGRWRDERRDLTLDIARCADKICGHAVDKDGQCGSRALLVSWRPTDQRQMPDDVAGGTLDLAARGGSYKVRLLLGRATATTKAGLVILGDGAAEPSLYRRWFPFHAELARIGDAACTPRPSS